MLLFIVFGCLAAKLRGGRMREVFREPCLIPMWVLEAVFWVFQICAWCGNYRFLPYGALLERAYMIALLPAVYRYGLYRSVFTGAGLVLAGSALNRVVTGANGGHMPVYPTLSRLTGYYSDTALAASGDAVHVLMTAQTKLNFLGDIFDVGYSVMSIGDILMHLFVTIVVCSTILARKGS